MRYLAMVCVLVFIGTQWLTAADDGLIESTEARDDMAPATDPAISFWRGARPVYAEKGPHGEVLGRYRTEIRSRWTKKNLYFLFICPYEKLHLNPSPNTSTETFRLWDWDVAEVFIGSDFQNIRRYREFEISPQGEWIDLDIDLAKPHHEDGWTWNSGFAVAARVDAAAKIWYGAMRIPFSALQSGSPSVGERFRINLFRSQGPPPDRTQVEWRSTMSGTFHVPERFGLLQLRKETAHTLAGGELFERLRTSRTVKWPLLYRNERRWTLSRSSRRRLQSARSVVFSYGLLVLLPLTGIACSRVKKTPG